MSGLTIALPSKGRLQEQIVTYLAERGLAVRQNSGARDYRATLDGIEGVDVRLLSSSDIAGSLAAGDVQLGVTGADLIGESAFDWEKRVALVAPLGFGLADVVVAVPRAWLDVATMADLDDVCTVFHLRHHRRLKVATKYPILTRRFFAAHGIADYRIVESLGATEGAPAAGFAEAIVDITTTGATLAANDLKILDDGIILKSQANLAAAKAAKWPAEARKAAACLIARMTGADIARAAKDVAAALKL